MSGLFKLLISKYRSYIDPVGECRRLGATIGKDCVIRPSMCNSEPWLITLGDHVLLAPGTRLITHDGAGFLLKDIENEVQLERWDKIVIGNNVYVGTDAMIMPGVTITDNVIIGARSVVTKSITEDGVYVGSPAKRIKSFEEWKEEALKKNYNVFGMTREEKKKFFDKVIKDKEKNSINKTTI